MGSMLIKIRGYEYEQKHPVKIRQGHIKFLLLICSFVRIRANFESDVRQNESDLKDLCT